MFSGQGNIAAGERVVGRSEGTADIYGWACWGLGGRPRPVLGGLASTPSRLPALGHRMCGASWRRRSAQHVGAAHRPPSRRRP